MTLTRRSALKFAAALPLLQGIRTPCFSGDARDNRPGDRAKDGVDWVPPGWWCVYSPRIGGFQNVKMNLFPLVGGRVLVFGTGYGDMVYNLRGAVADMALVHQTIRDCMGLTFPPLVIVAPHWHPDHVSPEAVHELRRLGYPIQSIWTHVDDRPWYVKLQKGHSDVSWMYDGNPQEPWWAEDVDAWHETQATGCANVVLNHPSPLGTVKFRNRPEHSPGTLDLIINDLCLLGSNRNTSCPPFPVEIPAHGNVII